MWKHVPLKHIIIQTEIKKSEDNAAIVVFICYGNRGVCWREEVSHTGSPTSLYDIEATGTLRAQERTDRVINEGCSQHVSIAS